MAILVTLATFDSAPEAHIVKGLLESAGIPSFIHNEYLVGVQWLYSTAVGGVQVQVLEKDLETALYLLCTAVDPGDAGKVDAVRIVRPSRPGRKKRRPCLRRLSAPNAAAVC